MEYKGVRYAIRIGSRAWIARKGTDPFFAYDANYLIDNKTGIIVDVRISAMRLARVPSARRFDLKPQRLAGDTVYGAVRLLKWLVDRKIAPHVPVWDRSARSDGTFGRDDFVFDHERNVYICPSGVELASTGNVDQAAELAQAEPNLARPRGARSYPSPQGRASSIEAR